MKRVFLGIDVGKTNLRINTCDEELNVLDRWRTSSADVPAALQTLAKKLQQLQEQYDILRAGVAIFGPLQVAPEVADYGALAGSSERVWCDVNVPRLVSATLRRPVFFDFDVNAGALAEAAVGAGRGVSSFVYLSVGTGVGGAYVSGTPRAGYAPQLGHMFVPREADDLTSFTGTCGVHGDCLQGLASGKALKQRWGVPAENLLAEHVAWDLEARYLATACANLIYTFAPERIVLGSSVAQVEALPELVNHYLMGRLRNFLEPALRTRYAMERPVVRAALTPDSSLVGATVMARESCGLLFK